MLISMKEAKAGKDAHPMAGSFLFSREVMQALRDKVSPDIIEDVLEKTIRLEQYGAVRRIHFLAIVRPAEDIRDQHLGYRVDEQEISIQIGVDARAIEQAPSADAATGFLARCFLAAIPLFSELPVPGFAISAFFRDVETCFRRQGWLDAPLPEPDQPAIALVWETAYKSGWPDSRPAGFFARKIARREWFDAIDEAALTARLNQMIDLARYGPGVAEIYLSFLADGIDADPVAVYFPSDRELHLTLPLDTRSLLKEDRRNIVGLICRALLSAEPLVANEAIPDFDAGRFFRRAEEVFTSEG